MCRTRCLAAADDILMLTAATADEKILATACLMKVPVGWPCMIMVNQRVSSEETSQRMLLTRLFGKVSATDDDMCALKD
jgi:hypothetical protein